MKFVPANLVGQRFSRLVVRERYGVGTQGEATWLCRCDCGVDTVVTTKALRRGSTKSCGCLKRPHGKTNTPTWRTWKAMRQRCENESHHEYVNYGGRGIRVCDRWQSFEDFLADMGEKPSATHSIDRIDNDRGYEPSNCRWATKSEQAQNTRPALKTLSQLPEIRERLARGESRADVARATELDPSTISRIATGVNWS